MTVGNIIFSQGTLRSYNNVIDRRNFGKGILAGAAGASMLSLTGCPMTTAQWIDTVLSDLPAILSVTSEILSLAGASVVPPQLEVQIQNILNQVSMYLNLVKDLVNQYKTAPDSSILTKIDAALIDAQANLSSLLAIFHVSDQTLQATVSGLLGVAIATLFAIQALIPSPAGATTARKNMSQKNGANVIKESFNFIVAKNYPTHVIK